MVYFEDVFSISMMCVTKLVTYTVLLYLCHKSFKWDLEQIHLPLMWYLCKYFIKLGLVRIRTLIIRIIGTSNNQNLRSNLRFPQHPFFFCLLELLETPVVFLTQLHRTQFHVDTAFQLPKGNWIKWFILQWIISKLWTSGVSWKGKKIVLMWLGNIASVSQGMLL